MRALPNALQTEVANSAVSNAVGPFFGANGFQTRLTVQPTWYLWTQAMVPVGGAGAGGPSGLSVTTMPPEKWPVRWFQDQANSQVEYEIPNLKQVITDNQLTNQAATIQIEIFNTQQPANGTAGTLPDAFGNRGWLGPYFGSSLKSRTSGGVPGIPLGYFNQTPGFWQGVSSLPGSQPWPGLTNTSGVLREGALIRVYQGIGGNGATPLTIPEAVEAGNLILKGVYMIDTVSIESQTGIITLTGRSTAKLLLDQFLWPPLVPQQFYTSSGIEFYPPMEVPYAQVPGYGFPYQQAPVVSKKSKEGFALSVLGGCAAPNGEGYAMVGSDGSVFAFSGTIFGYGGIANIGDEGGLDILGSPIVGMDMAGTQGDGYWLCGQDGSIYSFGSAAVPGVTNGFSGALTTAATLSSANLASNLPITIKQGVNDTIQYSVNGANVEILTLVPGTYTGMTLASAISATDIVADVPAADTAVANGETTIPAGTSVVLTLSTVGTGPNASLELISTGTNPDNAITTTSANNLGFAGKVNDLITGTSQIVASSSSPPNPVVAFRSVPPNNEGYYIFTSNGSVYSGGPSGAVPTIFGQPTLASGVTIVDAAVTLDGKGYALLTNTGYVYAYGSVSFASGQAITPSQSTSSAQLPTAIELDSTGNGAWVISNVFTYSPTLSTEPTTWLPYTVQGVAPATGDWVPPNTISPTGIAVQINAIGSPPTYNLKGSNSAISSLQLQAPISTIRRSIDGLGFWLFGMDGAVFTFGDADFYGTLTGNNSQSVAYTQWIGSNYVSPYNNGLYQQDYFPIPSTTPQGQWPIDPVTGIQDTNSAYAPVLLAPDYMEIVRLICLWAGFYWPPSGAFNSSTQTLTVENPSSSEPIPLFGAVWDSGAYNVIGPLDSSTFDKVSCMDAIQSICQAVGYIFYIRDDGSVYAGLPNWYYPGNFIFTPGDPYSTSTASSGYTTDFPVFSESKIIDFTLQSSDANLRSEIIVSPVDPYMYDNSPAFPNAQLSPPGTSHTVTRLAPGNLQTLHGLVKQAMIGVPLNVPISIEDQDLMAELQAIQIWQSVRTATLVSVYDFSVCPDDQIRVYDRLTGTTDMWYVLGVHVEHDLDTGQCVATYTLQWLGSDTDAWSLSSGSTLSGAVLSNQTFDANGNLISNPYYQIGPELRAQLAKGLSPAATTNPNFTPVTTVAG